ncbi:DUF1345 domain-containing protein [Deinococcus sp. HMF7620]|uniref:DUF1345 domain-containing protein n=1 Tax=Deinococcus arboris TaxID=2682977 RepID=A0A7C9LLB9_9DEIO|nr:DUF1345 domain-containing protein [Deinococcus arboris]MVN85556.1 DUF1345 domain-containing protein [Deinococcus arboris]
MPHFQLSSAAARLLRSALTALFAALLTPADWPLPARLMFGWLAFCAVFMAQLWPTLLRADAPRTRTLATHEDDSRVVAGAVALGAALVSLAGVVSLLVAAGHAPRSAELALTGLALLTVVASWLLVQTEYTLHYARRFYRDGHGAQFTGPDNQPLPEPTYQDFAYLAATIGMTYQVSDTTLTTRAMRQLLLGHALLSFVFGTVIIAVTINGVAGLIR